MHRYITTASIMLGLLGCNALDEKGSDTGSKLLIPVDERPVQQALTAPPPISGGTLAVSPDGLYAIAADPDRDRVSIVTLASRSVRHVALDKGDEPGRVAIDASSGRAYVALRRGGAVARIDLVSGALLARTRVCPSPRGLVHEAQRDLLHVACADGRLVSLDAQGATARSVNLGTDLRDVMVRGDQLLVSTYKSAELLTVNVAGAVMARSQAGKVEVEQFDPRTGEAAPRAMQPHLAWRSLQGADGSVWMLHQNASESMVDVESEPTPDAMSSYGGGGGRGFSCGGIVHSAVTDFGTMSGVSRSLAIAGGVVAVDMARSPRDNALAIALPGAADPDAPRPTVVFDEEGFAGASIPGPFLGEGGQVAYFDANTVASGGQFDTFSAGSSVNCQFPQGVAVEGQPTAVAFTPGGGLVVQSREPALLTVMSSPPQGTSVRIDLGGDSVRDTGHDVFHRDAGAGIACASCHGEGGDDGHTWLFSGSGMRRTQSVNIGLEGTAPFHWNGDLHDLGALMEQVFVGRMGGVHQSDKRLAALSGWLFAQRPPTPIVQADDPAAERGQALFESSALGCVGCHNGESFTDNRSYDVGTSERPGEKLQVPSLRGVGYRAPFIHTGCAETLRDRFDPTCGGDKHGNTAQLDTTQIDDLVAYLQTL